jgi:site-specific recombinase XerD
MTAATVDDFVPVFVPVKKSSTVKYRIIMKKGYVNKEGTFPLYIEINGNGRCRFNLNMAVKPNQWNKIKQEVKNNHEQHIDYNLLINQYKAQLNKILINYRLSDRSITAQMVLECLNQPNILICFNAFAKAEQLKEKGILKNSTIRAQKSSLDKIKEFQDPLYFNEIDTEWLKKFTKWLSTKKNLAWNTVQSHLKNLRKFIGLAEEAGIYLKIQRKQIKVGRFDHRVVFLTAAEINKLDKYYNSEFIRPSHKYTLQRFLFSCFTGLRISEIYNLTSKNIAGGFLNYVGGKPPYPFISFQLSDSAMKYIELPHIWSGEISKEKLNAALKVICNTCGIDKKVSMHIARHTFATQYLLTGGNPVNLQSLMGHSSYRMTEKYVHVTNLMVHQDIHKMDSILNIDTDQG